MWAPLDTRQILESQRIQMKEVRTCLILSLRHREANIRKWRQKYHTRCRRQRKDTIFARWTILSAEMIFFKRGIYTAISCARNLENCLDHWSNAEGRDIQSNTGNNNNDCEDHQSVIWDSWAIEWKTRLPMSHICSMDFEQQRVSLWMHDWNRCLTIHNTRSLFFPLTAGLWVGDGPMWEEDRADVYRFGANT
jgi:hypothetical protein